MRLVHALALCVIVLLSAWAGAAAPSPAAVIESLHQSLVETMRNAQNLGMDGRYKQLEPVLVESFDFPRMIAAACGSYWMNADERQRQLLLNAFTRLSVMTYAARFSSYSGESFETIGERQGPRDTTLVDTRLIRNDGPPVPITYVMAEQDGTWRIVDVLLDKSISELAVRRSEYNQVLRSSGTEGLTQILNQKAMELGKG